jgi:hypothetical protein
VQLVGRGVSTVVRDPVTPLMRSVWPNVLLMHKAERGAQDGGSKAENREEGTSEYGDAIGVRWCAREAEWYRGRIEVEYAVRVRFEDETPWQDSVDVMHTRHHPGGGGGCCAMRRHTEW